MVVVVVVVLVLVLLLCGFACFKNAQRFLLLGIEFGRENTGAKVKCRETAKCAGCR